jgi:hypothetical protein
LNEFEILDGQIFWEFKKAVHGIVTPQAKMWGDKIVYSPLNGNLKKKPWALTTRRCCFGIDTFPGVFKD